MRTNTDDELIQRIKEADQAALEVLFERYYYALCDFAFQYVRSFDLTEEIVSDVFLNIWKRRERLNITSSFKAYIFRAVRNQSINYLKKENRDFDSLDLLENEASEEYQPDEELIFCELENRIEVLLNTLPPRRKLIFKLSRIEGFTYQEIADILSISIHTVQNQMVQAVKTLATYSVIDRQ
ncbi:MAG TPA: RNA polymerase sigma-70 factor [Balneolaceae bacterium]|nr:RNA polymerase sigma-70 factor [Balneolaceae bacterium]